MKPDLSQLRDIHLPEPISWWPPAPGWWLLAALIVAIVLGLYVMYRRHRRNGWRRSALAELASLRQQLLSHHATPHIIVSGLSVLLRRVAISCFPREEVAVLSGDKWLAFLDRTHGEGAPFQSDQGRLLTVAAYAPYIVITPDEMRALFTLCKSWINKLPVRGKP